MEKMILSLKNIYMLLMTEDFPIYSESVIGRKDRKGLTIRLTWTQQSVRLFLMISITHRKLPCAFGATVIL